ncbi:MAG: carbohydrate kinase [Clostridia bacterium]|nr:carbohydrate kinase [Clostridia bacterium]
MIICVGEILADMLGVKVNGDTVYTQKAGGAPFNVACAIARQGGDIEFYGSVGNDLVGKFLIDFADNALCGKAKISTIYDKNTTLAFVSNDENGERSFCFYRKGTADYDLPQIDDETLNRANIIHIGSLCLSENVGRDYARELITRAKKASVKVSFDINYREDIYPDRNSAIKIFSEFISLADIVKFSQDEVEIFGEEFVNSLVDKTVFITLGGDGSLVKVNGKECRAGSIKVKPVDTTGAGDAFYGTVLALIDAKSANYEDILRRGNIAGALTTLKRGAIDAIPTSEELEKYL